MEIEKNVVLAPLTTFKIGGKADYFCRVSNLADLKEVLEFAKEKVLPIFILGGGSNLVVRDEGFRGLVLKIELRGVEFAGEEVVAGAGENWDNFVEQTLQKKLYGFENLSGIPGTVGGAAVQNIGAYGVEVKKFINWVEVVNVDTLEVKKIPVSECAYEYRHSFFKTAPGRKWVITRVGFLLSDKPGINIAYRDLTEHFAVVKNVTAISPEDVRQAVLTIRSRKFPPLDKFGTAGSFFKNPIVSDAEAEVLRNRYPGLPTYDAGSGRKKVSLAWIIDRVCNLKGLRRGAASVSKEQALVLVSVGRASSKDVLDLAEKIKTGVREATGIEIETEVESV